MSAEFTLPQARIPIGWATVKGERVPVQIDMEWMLTLSRLFERSGGTSGDTSFTQYITQFFDAPPMDAALQEAIRAVDELRNELASSRSDVQSLRGRLDELEAAITGIAPAAVDWRERIEQIEGRLM